MDRKPITAFLTDKDIQTLDGLAERRHLTRSGVIREAIALMRDYLETEGAGTEAIGYFRIKRGFVEPNSPDRAF